MTSSTREDPVQPNALEQALDAVIKRHVESDRDRRQLLMEKTHRAATAYEETIVRDNRTSPSADATAHALIALSSGGAGVDLDEIFRAQPQVALADQMVDDHLLGDAHSKTQFREQSATVVAPTGHAENLSGRSQRSMLEPESGRVGHDVRQLRIPGNDSIVELADKLTTPFGEPSRAPLPAAAGASHDAAFTQALVDTLMTESLHSRAGISADLLNPLDERARDGREDQRFRSTQTARLRAREKGMADGDLVNVSAVDEPAISSIIGGGELSHVEAENRVHQGNSRMTSDRDGGWKSGPGAATDTGQDSAVQHAVAAAVDEVERLRAAVRRTIDELARVRGPVEPPLPALPPDRGAFRIS
jgi:hypothetical protein